MNFILSVFSIIFLTGFIAWATSVTSRDLFMVNSRILIIYKEDAFASSLLF